MMLQRPISKMVILSALAVVPLLFALGCDEFGSDEPIENRDDSFTVTPGVTVDVDSFNGAITVNATSGDTVRVKATLKRADKVDYEARQFGNSVQVSADRKGSTTGRSPSVTLDITAPANTILVLRTSNGAIEANGFDAGGTLNTSNGRITVDGMNGDLDAETSNGRVQVSSFTGSALLNTSNGSIRFEGELVSGSRNEMRTSNGSVIVDLDDDPSVEFDGSTSNGSVTSEFPLLVTRSGKSFLTGTIGDGDAELTVRSSNGSITVQ